MIRGLLYPSVSKSVHHPIKPRHGFQCAFPTHHELMVGVVNILLHQPRVGNQLVLKHSLDHIQDGFNRDQSFRHLFISHYQHTILNEVSSPIMLRQVVSDSEAWPLLVILPSEVLPRL